MKHKALELNLRQIMQGMEEFATFMSYKSNCEGLRILKVESQTGTVPTYNYTTDNIVSIEHVRSARSEAAANEVTMQKYH